MAIAPPALDVVPAPVTLLRRGDIPNHERAVRTKRICSVARGIYADAVEWRALAPWERYTARVHATAMRIPEARFVLESAAALRGAPVFGEPRDVHVVAPPSATSRAIAGVRVHTAQHIPEVEEIGGLLVATPAEIAIDTARSRHHAIGLAVVGSILRRHAEIELDALFERNRTRLSSRGRRHALWALQRASSVPESTLEHVSLAAIEWLGFPAPELQKWILGPGGDDDRLDFWWEEARIAGEADGDEKSAGKDAAVVLRVRRQRDARLLERGVSATAHWGWHDVAQGGPLRAALVAAGLQPVRPTQTAELRSLTRLLASFRPA